MTLIKPPQPHLDSQQPKIPILVKDRIGGVNQEVINLQTNQISSFWKFNIWIDDLLLPGSLVELAIKLTGAVNLGMMVSLLSMAGVTGLLFALPVVVILWGLLMICHGSHLAQPAYLYTVLFIFGFVVVVL